MGAPARLTVVCGLQGTGKTTVALRLAERRGAEVLRTDVIRKESAEPPDYSEAGRQRVYDEMLARARRLLGAGRDVVLDATFERRGNRLRAAELAREAGAAFRLVHVVCDPGVVRRRLAERDSDASDADWAVHQRARARFETPDPAAEPHATVDTSGTLDDVRAQADQLDP